MVLEGNQMSLIKVDETKANQLKEELVKQQRKTAYLNEADPLFFKAQRGEIDIQVWLDKVAEIKARYS